MFKGLRHFIFKVKRKLSIKLLNKNLYDGTLHIYITLRCNYDCPYCVNNYNKSGFEGYGYKLRSVEEWADKINNLNRDVIFTGGEPFLYKHNGKDLIDLVNKINKGIRIKIYSNIGIDLIEQLKKLKRPAEMTISFHPQAAQPDIILRNIDYLISNKKFRFYVHVVNAEGNMIHPNVDILKSELRKRNITVSVDNDQNFEGSERKFKICATCSKKIILLAPDGTRYHCVGKLMRRGEHLENIFETTLKKDLSVIECGEYGYCAPCDWLGETKIDVKGFVSRIPTIKEHIQKIYKIK